MKPSPAAMAIAEMLFNAQLLRHADNEDIAAAIDSSPEVKALVEALRDVQVIYGSDGHAIGIGHKVSQVEAALRAWTPLIEKGDDT